ncbi:hypothetical protein [Nocardia suismassiliense]|uniref:hypothetical protein n=1 Tax=Nocardia suismassiliense TaxID=2077092 RepID=UPI00131EE96A|nr:hypothetical protein [Nocardia suismassiliense]
MESVAALTRISQSRLYDGDVGVDAFVRCRCWQDGRTTAAPVPADLIVEDGAGYLTLSLPYEGHEDQHHGLDGWIRDGACPHEHMEFASERISNWSGYRLFRSALEVAGAADFPTLSKELPDRNGGQLSPMSASSALVEIAEFRDRPNVDTETTLVDASTGETLITAVPAYGGVFSWDGRTKHNFALDAAAGLTIVDTAADPESEIFRARNFTQKKSWRRGYWFTDLDTGQRTKVPVHGPINPTNSPSYPRRMRVQNMPVSPDRFDYILIPLTRVLQAAVDTSNPVVWC